MPNSARDRIHLFRKRNAGRKLIFQKKTILIFSLVVLLGLATVLVVNNVNLDNTFVSVSNPNDLVNDEQGKVEQEEKQPSVENIDKKTVKINFLGELMMGGKIGTTLNYAYSDSFKSSYSFLNDSDFNYINFSTVITNLDKITDPKSEYVVTKDIHNALNALQVNGVSLASDHMIDYPKNLFDNTLTELNKKNIHVAGLKDEVMYFEKNGKKIAIVSFNSVYINNRTVYTEYGISTYEEKKIIENIKVAKDNADFVIADVHWGRDTIFGLTDQMKKISKQVIEAGADLVVGTHAIGNYPIVSYQGKPIIYSTGNLMVSDLNGISRQKYIYSVYINEENKLEKIEMVPMYITNDYEVKVYSEYNQTLANDFNKQYNDWQIKNGLTSTVQDNKIVIKW